MPDRSTRSSQSVMIAAQPTEVFAVIADFASYPEWSDGLSSSEVLSRHADGSVATVRFVIDAGFVQDEFVLAYTWDERRLRVDWQLVSSTIQRSQIGSYELKPQGSQTEVTYTLAVDLNLPLLSLFKRRAEKSIMDIALTSLKRRVEGSR